ncbi:MAG: DUF4167 domain-containing protein [Brevundimonas sp.]|nr:DUF4167 domain-containing protein [Brevundimonas sp.]
MKRQRGRNRKPGGSPNNANNANPNRSWDSQGPENIKVRGNAQTVYERYQQLARDASSGGDRVLAENYMQHAEHYFRVLRALQPMRPVSEIAARELSNQGFDIDFEDESGAQAAAMMAAHQAELQRQQNQNGGNTNDGHEPREAQAQREPREPREWRDRDDREPRSDNRNDRNDRQDTRNEPREPREPRPETAADGEQPREGGRRETRRERWERRRDERNRRFPDNPSTEVYVEAGEGESAPAVNEAPEADGAEAAPTARERPARAPRAPRAERAPRAPREAEDDGPSALPGFLTRSSTPASAAAPVAVDDTVATQDAEAPAPKRRAPRRKVEAPVAED